MKDATIWLRAGVMYFVLASLNTAAERSQKHIGAAWHVLSLKQQVDEMCS